MLAEIYNYINSFPKQVYDIFKIKKNVCVVQCFGYTWYLDILGPENNPDDYRHWFDYLVASIIKVESENQQIIDTRVIRYLLSRAHPFISSRLYSIVFKLRLGYTSHQTQFIPFMFKQIDDDETRVQWKIFSALGFKSVKDSDFQQIINDPVLLKWVSHNIIRDQQEEVNKLKALQMFINPDLYREVYKQTKLTNDLMAKVNAIYGQIKAKGHIGVKKV